MGLLYLFYFRIVILRPKRSTGPMYLKKRNDTWNIPLYKGDPVPDNEDVTGTY
jgi:hypothetical protein